MRLLTLYERILESLHVYSDDVGLLTRRQLDGQSDQILVSVDGASKRLVLPKPELLRKGLPEELVAFHPLSEVSNRGESEVFRKLKLLVNLRLTTTILALMEDLTELAADKKRHSSLPPKLLPLLEAMPQADQKLIDNLTSLLGAALSGGKNRLLSIYLNRGGKYMGQKRARLAVVSFPILEELENPERKVFGVQLRAKDIPQIKALFEWLLPGCHQEGTYSAYSDSLDAPFFEALMLAYAKVATKLNHAQKIASKYLDDSSSLRIDLSWVPDLEGMEALRFEIPALEGNKGIVIGNGKAEEAEPVVTKPSALQALQARVSEPEPIQPRGHTPMIATVDEVPFYPKQLAEESKSGIRSDLLTSGELRAQREGMRPIVAAAAPSAAQRTSGEGRTFAEITGRGAPMQHTAYPQPPMGPPAMYGNYPAAPAPAYGGGWGSAPAPQTNPFAMMNAQRPQPQPQGGWNSGGWSTNTGWGGGGRL